MLTKVVDMYLVCVIIWIIAYPVYKWCHKESGFTLLYSIVNSLLALSIAIIKFFLF